MEDFDYGKDVHLIALYMMLQAYISIDDNEFDGTVKRLMDAVWLRLSDETHEWLNARS